MSASKAAAVAVPIFFLLVGLTAKSFKTRLTLVIGLVAAVFAIAQVVDVGALFRTYRKNSDSYERTSALHKNDNNYVYGRVAGLFIVPRMVAAHPLTGIGWGNYGLVRNSPEYRGASEWAQIDDDPGLGIAGLTADLGLPLFVGLLCCIASPVFTVSRLRVPGIVASLVLAQPVVHLCGAQLNVTYPWIVTSFGLGLAFFLAKQATLTAPSQTHTVS
jgi:O-antigen ligase